MTRAEEEHVSVVFLRHTPVVFEGPRGRVHDRGEAWSERYSAVRKDHPRALDYRTLAIATAAVEELTLAEAYTVLHAQSRDCHFWDGRRFDIAAALIPAGMTVLWKCVNYIPYTPAEEAYASLPEAMRLVTDMKYDRERSACWQRFHQREDAR